MIFRFSFFISCLIIFSLNIQIMDAQHKAAYQLFDIDGNAVEYDDLLKSAAEADVIFFGEFHDNPICHWLQYELLTDLFNEFGERLVFGGEFFEADDQMKIDEYFADIVSQNNFENEARFWNNYKTDYKRMVEFAKSNGIPFVATNVPRRYANLVFRQGVDALDQLSEEAFSYMADIPFEVDFELRSYQMMMEMAHGERAKNFVYAQAIKDVTMAHFINENLNEDQVFYHINGTFHTKYDEGIIWYLKRMRPELNILNIGSILVSDASEWDDENQGFADFILAIPENMSRSY